MLEKERLIKFLLQNGFVEDKDGYYERPNTALSIVTTDPEIMYKIIVDGVYIYGDCLYCCINKYENHIVALKNLKYVIVKDIPSKMFTDAREKLIKEIYEAL